MPYPVECLLEVNEDVIEVFLVLEVLHSQYPKVEDLLCCNIIIYVTYEADKYHH